MADATATPKQKSPKSYKGGIFRMINLKFHTLTFFEKKNADWGCSIPHEYAGNTFYTIFEPANIKYFEETQTLTCTGSEVHEKKAFPTQRGAIIRPGKAHTGEKCILIPANYTYIAETNIPSKIIDAVVKPHGGRGIIPLSRKEKGEVYKAITYLDYHKENNKLIIECDGQIKDRKVQHKGALFFQDHEIGTQQLLIHVD